MPRGVRNKKHRGGVKWKRSRGVASNYINVTKILRKLQLSLKDFRRLCILKGMHPRNVPGKHGKLYYHKKDVAFLTHEPLIERFRKLKTFMKKYKKALGRRDKDTARRIKEQIPEITVDHLVRERYPTFLDALRDYDDALNQLFLFRSLPVKITKSYTGPVANRVERVCNEWHKYVAEFQLLRKAFISIKGYYLQAEVRGVPVTWLVPHRVVQVTKFEGVDLGIMTTFLHFYQTMARFLNFKLFKDEGVSYPPPLPTDSEQVEEIFGKGARAITDERTAAAAASRNKTPQTSAETKKMQDMVSRVAARLTQESKYAEDGNDDEDQKEDEVDDTDEFNRLDPSHAPEGEDRASKLRSLFKGKVFLIGREVNPEIISMLIRAGGGKCIHELLLTEQQIASSVFTHQICDRKRPSVIIASRVYVQPQWVFDSFNEAFLLPTAPYAPGEKLPPHLSPFVDDRRAGYIPEQRKKLREWTKGADESKKAAPKAPKLSPKEEEAKYQEELRAELLAIKKAKNNQSKPADEHKSSDSDEEEEDEEEGSDADAGDDLEMEEDFAEEEDFDEDLEEDLDEDDMGEDVPDSTDDEVDLAESGDEEEEDEMESTRHLLSLGKNDDTEDSESSDNFVADDDDDDFAQFEAPKPQVPRPSNVHVRDTEAERMRMILKKKEQYIFDKNKKRREDAKARAEFLGKKRRALEQGEDPNQISIRKVLRRR